MGVIAVDGTKVHANASRDANLDYEQLAREILEEAKAVDAAEDELYGDARGDELPEQLPGDYPAAARTTAEPMWLEPYPDGLLEDLPDSMPGP
jgi:hypothetical protein